MRTSESKTIINQELFDVKLPDYQRIIERLVSKYNVVDGSYYEGLVNFKANLVVPKHKWYDYKQGYSELLVKHIIDEAKPLKEHYILDPFCGVGTTNLTSVNRGYKTIGFDINPMAILTAKAKTHHYTPKEIALIKKYLESFTLPDSKVEIEGGRVIETSFTEDVLDILLKIRFFVDGINNDAVQDFFRLALISIIDKCSLKIKDGNGLKFKKNYKAVPDLVRLYLDKASEMLSDIRMSNEDKENKIILGSMITEEAFNKVKDMPIGLCVFSPPYANCFDYCEVYKLEFWIGGFVKSYDDFERFRSIALRSHVNSKFSHEFSNSNKDVDTIASLISSFNIWNKNIPDMIRGYFDDMESMIKNLSKILVNKAKCYIVVANSGYKGILVPTDLLLAEIAEKYGYKVCNIYHARKIRSSSQQMHILNTNYNNLMRESIIEFKTPLTLIFSQVEIMLQSKSLPPKLYNRLLSIWRNATRMNKLIVELMEFRKQEQGFLKLHVNYNNIVNLVNEISLSFKEYADTRKINLKVKTSDEDISFYYDSRQMEKVLFNLLSNAFKFTPDNGNITIEINKNADKVQIKVIDTGIGISSKEINKIFDRFYQSEDTNYSNKYGTGIGLAFAKNIVEAHKGTIQVKSRKVEGSSFIIEMPLNIEYPTEQIQSDADVVLNDFDRLEEHSEDNIPDDKFFNELIKQQEEANTRNSKILIVEDNEEVRNLLVSIFEPIYIVDTAVNGAEGYEKTLNIKPDIVLSDVVMPEISGTELCRKIKTNIETSHIPIILLTSQTASEYIIEGLKIGADDYITKPFSIKHLIIRCNNLVNSRKMLQAKFTKEINTSVEMIATSSLDQSLIEDSIRIINENFDNPMFNIDFLAQQVGMGRTKFFSKIKGITGLTPNEFIINTKLKAAIKILREDNNISINELAFQLGFSSTSYFIKLFKELVGMTPTQYKLSLTRNKNE